MVYLAITIKVLYFPAVPLKC